MGTTEPTITCSQCGAVIKLTESLAAPLIEATRRELEQKLAKDRGEIAADEARKARQALGAELDRRADALAELEAVVKERDAKLVAAQAAEVEARRMQRELADAKRELDLTVEKRVQAGLGATREQARIEAEDRLKLKLAEKEQTLASMQRKIEELQRRAEQGSQQLQGEVQELALEDALRATFPRDAIEPVPKGEHGGDAVQRVFGAGGQCCGAILWESKRTKNWSDGWLAKLREDQRAAKAEIAVIVSQALPKGLADFGLVDGVWVAPPRLAVAVAAALRQSLLEVAAARKAGVGQQTKMELVYQYLTGPRFRQRVQAMVEAFSSMKEDLDKERRAITKQWAKREEQIDRMMHATVGMYGDLEGIAGKTLQEIEGLALPALTDGESEE